MTNSILASMTPKTLERHTRAVAAESARDALYAELLAAQLAHGQAAQALADAAYRLQLAQAAVDDLDD